MVSGVVGSTAALLDPGITVPAHLTEMFFLLACRAQSSMPNTMNFTWFLALLGAGLLFSILAFSLFLPIIILAPSKFAICFTIGSALIMSAFVSLRGWKGQLAHMFSTERLPFTAGELGLSVLACWVSFGKYVSMFPNIC